MITGRIDDRGQAKVPLEIRARSGRFHSLEAIVDTGFSGYLTLDPEAVEQLDLRPMRTIDVSLAGNLRRTLNTFRGQVVWHHHLRTVRILEANGIPLVGMRLLAGSLLTVQVREGGQVLIEEM